MGSDGFTSEEDEFGVLDFVAKEPAEALGIEREATDKVLKDKRIRKYFLKPKTVGARIFCVSFWIIVTVGLAALFWWLTPLVLKHVVIPIQNTVQDKWNPVAVAFLVIAGIIVVPIILIPAGPFIWLAAVSLGVWKGFLVVQVGTAINMAITFLLGRLFLRDRIRRKVENKDWAQALFIAVKEAGPFKVVLLMRLGPAPYSLLSYTCSLSPDIRFWPYVAASVIGRSLHNVIDIYIGTGVSTAGEAAAGEELDPVLITFYAVGFVFAIILSLWAYLYAKRTLRDLRARAVAREQVLTAFSFPELDDELSEIEMGFETRDSLERRKSFRGSRKDQRAESEEDKGLLAESGVILSDSMPHTPNGHLTGTPRGSRRLEHRRSNSLDRHRSGSLDGKALSSKLKTMVVADASSHPDIDHENESDDVALLHKQPRSAD